MVVLHMRLVVVQALGGEIGVHVKPLSIDKVKPQPSIYQLDAQWLLDRVIVIG